jgi:MYXO-CTERM domain-containing protein
MCTRHRLYARASALTLILSAGSGCVAEPGDDREDRVGVSTSALIGGNISNEDPAIVALSTGGTTSFCTGTLVSPSVVLTAAHCIDMAGVDPNIIAFFGTDLSGDGTRIGIGLKTQHLMWTGSVGSHDIGLLRLNFPQDPFLPVRLNTSPLDQHLGEPYRHVGFGVYDRTTQEADGKKREGTTAISATQGDIVESGDDQIAVCFGDSGGPGLISIDGVEYVAGIHSYTQGAECFPPSGDTRVDLYVESFILPWIQDNDPVCGMDGTCGPIGCIDDPDCTPCGADGNCTSNCALPDPDCPTSAVGEICQANSQCETGLCVYWPADDTYHFCSEPCSGNGDCPSGMSCQSIAPFGEICYYDEDPPGVIGDECDEPTDCGSYVCEENRCTKACDLGAGLGCPEAFSCDTRDDENYFCFSDDTGDGGGCRIGQPAGSGHVAVLLLLGAVALWLGRRR